MSKSKLSGKWACLIAAAAVLGSLLAGCASPTPTADANPSGELATLQQQVAVQQTSIAGLQAQADLSQLVAAQATQIAALQTQVALAQSNAAAPKPTAAATSLPTPTIIPAVAGLVTDANTKGAASARVTMTEYVDYF